ncbi:MAG: hypothetical protein JJT94_13000 [Bernardetiaceae bacterium]|nr:hypothetical protein [Bernardetiaceae bacterium]
MSKDLILLFSDKKNEELSPMHKQFNWRIKRLNALESEYKKVKNEIADIKRIVQEQVSPLINDVAEKKIQFLKILDEAYQTHYFSYTEKRKIKSLILDKCFEIEKYYGGSPVVDEIYARYEDKEEDSLGVFDILNDLSKAAEQVLEGFQKGMEEGKKTENTEQSGQTPEEKQKVRHLQKSDKLAARLYKQLAKILHPDREPDEQKRVLKNELMQKLAEAYKKKDIFSILKLQAEYGDTDTKEDIFDQEQLDLLNNLLAQQIKRYEQDIHKLTVSGQESSLYKEFKGSKNQKEIRLEQYKQSLIQQLEELIDEVHILTDKRKLRNFLYYYEEGVHRRTIYERK